MAVRNFELLSGNINVGGISFPIWNICTVIVTAATTTLTNDTYK